jgi:type II restriction/modification system DNA methylase subunit YeeA
MDTAALKKFAQSARSLLMEQVRSKLDLVLDLTSAARREHPKAMGELDTAIARESKAQVIEQVAYTWFNRFTALRFMDVNSYTSTGIVSPAEGQTRPEILSEAMAGNLPDGAPANIIGLLDGRTPSSDPQAEAYRLLLVHACNQWHDQMPFLFEKLDDYTELLMPEDMLSQASILAEMRKVMTQDVCQDVEVIGWLYQFYISEKKDQVFAGLKKNQKITAENIPAATQLFTPHWIVRYLVENSLGRLWLLNRPASKLAAQMDYYIAPEEPETDFLKISKPEEIKVCDPACGSGHMLTYAFDLLYAIYEEEGYDPAEIPALILKQNLYGVEIDDRAGALAAFALAMKAAARLGRRRYMRMEVTPNICVLQDVSFSPAEMQDVATVVGRDLFTADLRETLAQFEQAKNFGSLIVPKLRDPAEVAQLVRLKDFGGDLLLREVQDRVLSVLEMAEALSPKYHVVVANPPYAGAGGLNQPLQDFAKKTYPNSKTDLFSMFMERSLNFVCENGYVGMINLPSWLFLKSFEKLRSNILNGSKIESLLHMGRGIFGIDWGSTAFCIRKSQNSFGSGIFFRLHERNFQHIYPEDIAEIFLSAKQDENFKFDFDSYRDSTGVTKISHSGNLRARKIKYAYKVADFEKIPGSPIAYWLSKSVLESFSSSPPLHKVAPTKQGLATGDNDQFLRIWFETSLRNIAFDCGSSEETMRRSERWYPCNKGGEFRKWYGNNSYVVDWSNSGKRIKKLVDENGKQRSRPQNETYYFKPGLTWSAISSSSLSMRLAPTGAMFETKGAMCFPDAEDMMPVLAFSNTKIVNQLLLALSPTLDFHEGPVGKLPYKSVVEAGELAMRCVEITQADWDSSELSWDFQCHPLVIGVHKCPSIAIAYQLLTQIGAAATKEVKELEEAINSHFIKAYGLEGEITADVQLDEVTLFSNPAHRYGTKVAPFELETRLRADTMAEYLSYAVGCMFGRYSLDEPGLILANQGETLADYLTRVQDPRFMPDKDNVIPVLDSDWFADDITERFRQFLRVTFGETHFRENLKFIEDSLGKDIRRYFTKDFYADHVKRYKKRPIYWMFSSPKGTFNALIYMHRYQPDTVSVMLNDYLREFISKLATERGRLEKLSDDPSASQVQRTKALKDIALVAKQIDELTEWERDVVFPLAQAKIEIDLDDGVKANYPKFGPALKKIPGLEDKDD